MDVYFYFSVFPMEALIASQLTPSQFGAYMATGSKKGSAEQIIFATLRAPFGADFDWEYAREHCVPHPNGDPKHSVYLSVYRVLEHIPVEAFDKLYLTTRDGRTLELESGEFVSPGGSRSWSIYQELCPVHPVIVSKLDPQSFGDYLTGGLHKVTTPRLVFCDLKAPNLQNPDKSGNIGGMYDNLFAHLHSCVSSIMSRDKDNKTFSRSNLEKFSFQTVRAGFFVAEPGGFVHYPMPDVAKLKQIDYDWARSAMII